MAAATPESGTGTTMSASAGCSTRQSLAHLVARFVDRLRRRSANRGARNRRARRCTSSAGAAAKDATSASPVSSITIISPGSTSRTYCASIRSKAQVSEAITHASSKSPQSQRTKAARVADRDQSSSASGRASRTRLRLAQALRYGFDRSSCARARDAVQHDFRVRGRREDRAFALQSLPLFGGERQIAVVTEATCPCWQATRKGCASRMETSPAVE